MPRKSKEETMEHPELSFEAALGRLEDIVKQLERGDLPLEQSLDVFAEGVGLSKECLKKLNTAEQRIDKILKEEQGQVTETIFQLPEEHTT